MYYYSYGYPYSNPYDGTMNHYSGDQRYWPYPYESMDPSYWNSYYVPDENSRVILKDYGPNPYVVNIEDATKQNNSFRTTLWTGKHMQVTLMRLKPGEDIGLEMHPTVDQFLRIEQGQGVVLMGKTKNNLNFKRTVFEDSAILVPAGTWHNLINTGKSSLKLYSIYAPPNHPFNTIHRTKAEAEAAEKGNHRY